MIVYRLFCRVTKKAYIGATRQTLKARMHRHRTRAATPGEKGTMYPLYQAAREHGWESFDVDILNRARSLDELQAMEKAAILLYRTLVPDGYNQILEDRDKVKWLTTTAGWNKGVKHTPKARARMAASHTGAQNHRARVFEYQGVVYPCMQDCAKITGLTRNQLYGRMKRGQARYLTAGIPGDYGAPHYRHTMETRAKMSAYRREHHPRRRAIVVDGQTYPSIIAAVGVSGYTRDQLKRLLKKGVATYVTTSAPS